MLLEVNDLHVFYGRIEAIKGVSFSVGEGEIVTLIGANGAGKTTTLRTLSGVRSVAQGSVSYDGRDITSLAPHERVQAGICQSPEGRGIFPGMTVLENLEMGAYTRVGKDAHTEAELDHVFDLFPRLKERVSQLGGTLSGGEQQMLAIARSLMARPRLLLLDEPSLGLAPKLVQELMQTLASLHRDGLAMLLVEQNARAALEIADRGVVLEAGAITLQGAAHALLQDERLHASYLGAALQ